MKTQKRRTTLEICADILAVCSKEQLSMTQVMLKARINTQQAHEFLGHLLQLGHMEKANGYYRTNVNGMEYLKKFLPIALNCRIDLEELC